MKLKQQTTDQPRSFDAATTQQIIGMAARLKAERSEQLSQAQVEAIAAEVGIEPEFVRQSLSYVTEEPVATRKNTPTQGRRLTRGARLVASLGWLPVLIPLLWPNHGGVTSVMSGMGFVDSTTLMIAYAAILFQIYLFVSVGLLRLARDARAGRALGWVLALRKSWSASGWLMPLIYLLLGGAGGPGFLSGLFWTTALYFGGVFLLNRLSPKEEPLLQPATPAAAETQTKAVSREALLSQLFSLQQQLEGTRTPLSFLSLDVVGSSGIKKASSELAVEYTFSAYRRFLLGIVQAEGGELQVAAGDGVMCVFRDEAAAIRAGQRILTELSQFNAAHNKLTEPLRIRAGVNSGPVAWEPGVPIGFLQSVVIDDAARIQKDAEPNSLALRDPYNAEQVITWTPS